MFTLPLALMYSREEASAIRKRFWTVFGQYMKPHLSASGIKINWINYKTGVKHIRFRMDVMGKEAYIGIELHHPDTDIRELFYEQFLELKSFMHAKLDEEWIWEENVILNETKLISRIYTKQRSGSIYNQENWSSHISFLKERIIKLDEFWEDARYSFDALK